MDKSPDAFRTISEVAVDLDLPQHVLRFWETRFAQIKPLKRGGGRRYYRPDDVELLKGIRHLLYGEGYTIRGVQRILKEQGVRFVMNVWHDGAPQPPAGGAAWGGETDEAEPDDRGANAAAGEEPDEAAYAAWAPHRDADPAARPATSYDEAAFEEPRDHPAPEPFTGPAADHDTAEMAQRFAPRSPTPDEGEPMRPPVVAPDAPRTEPPALGRASRLPAGIRSTEPSEPPRQGFGQFLDRLRPGGHREGEAAAPGKGSALSRDEIRRLQSTLFELLECKRLLDQVR